MHSLLRRDLFVHSSSGLLRCTLCNTDWMTSSSAVHHEDSEQHVWILRDLDLTRPRSSSPPVLDCNLRPPMLSSSPAHHCAELNEFDPDMKDVPMRFVHGPALPGDHPLQLYDNWAGELGEQFQPPPDEHEFEGFHDEETSPRHPSPIPECPSYVSFAPSIEPTVAHTEGERFAPNALPQHDDDEDYFPWTGGLVNTLVGIQSVRGQDTNFWVRLDEQVSVLYDKLGPQVTSDSWKGWADGIIARDQLRYKEDSTEEIMNPSFDDEHYAAGTQWQYD